MSIKRSRSLQYCTESKSYREKFKAYLSLCCISSLSVAKFVHLNWTIISLLLEIVTVLEIEKMVVSTSRYFNCASLIMKLLDQFGIKDKKKGFIFSVLQEAWREQELNREAIDR